MEQMTVKKMAAFLNQAVKEGKGDLLLVTGNDNEGNGYHGVFFALTEITDSVQSLIHDSHAKTPDKAIIIG